MSFELQCLNNALLLWAAPFRFPHKWSSASISSYPQHSPLTYQPSAHAPSLHPWILSIFFIFSSCLLPSFVHFNHNLTSANPNCLNFISLLYLCHLHHISQLSFHLPAISPVFKVPGLTSTHLPSFFILWQTPFLLIYPGLGLTLAVYLLVAPLRLG